MSFRSPLVISPRRTDSSPRVCFLLESYHPVIGGTETQARILAEDLVSNGFEVTVITRSSSRSLKKAEENGKIRIYRLPPVGNGHLKKWGLLFMCLPKLLTMHRHYDLIYVPGFRALGIAAVCASKFLHKRCILRAVSNGEMSGEFFVVGLSKLRLRLSSFPINILLLLRNMILGEADLFVSVSSDITKELIVNGVSPGKITSIPNPVDTKRFYRVSSFEQLRLRQQLGLPTGNKLVIFTGRLVAYKGLPLLLQTWKKILRRHQHVNLLLVGAGGNDLQNCEAALKEYVMAHGLQKSVLFTGGVANVEEYLQASDLFVFPTENEAFGISLVEAMACGLPVIGTSVGGVKDILAHKQNGLVIEAGNAQQLYDALHTLMSDDTLAASLGRSALRTVQERYSREIVAKKYIDLFKQFLKLEQPQE